MVTPIREPWKSTMTDRERFNNQMRYKPVDRCFNMEFGYWDENFTQWEVFKKNNVKTNWEADILFNFDPIHTIGGSIWMDPPFEQKVIEEKGDKLILMN